MRFCKNAPDDSFPRRAPGRGRLWLQALALAFFLCGAPGAFGAPASASGIEVLDPQLLPDENGGYTLSAQTRIDFNARLEEAVGKGVPLTFLLEFSLEKPRWYWSNQVFAQKTLTWRLSYHALTRQYRLATGSLHQSFPDLASALRMLSHVRQWQVVEDALPPGTTLTASVRLRLDTAQLPKLFQVASPFGNSDWDLDSGWQSWKFTVPDEAQETPAP
jgi:hypothetical protein